MASLTNKSLTKFSMVPQTMSDTFISSRSRFKFLETLFIWHKVGFHKASIIEGAAAMLIQPSAEVGKYFPRNESGADVNDPYGRFFNTFTPSHVQ